MRKGWDTRRRAARFSMVAGSPSREKSCVLSMRQDNLLPRAIQRECGEVVGLKEHIAEWRRGPASR